MASDPGLFDGDEASEGGISPGRERRWGQARLILIMVGLATIVYGPTVAVLAMHQTPGAFVTGVGGLGSLVIGIVPLVAADTIGPAVSFGGTPARYLIAKTITGWRSVDLHQVVSVRYRFNAPNTYGNELIVADVHGARLGVMTWDSPSLDCIGDAVRRRAGRGVMVSRTAFHVLGLDDEDREEYTMCRDRGLTLRAIFLGFLVAGIYIVLVAAVVASGQAPSFDR